MVKTIKMIGWLIWALGHFAVGGAIAGGVMYAGTANQTAAVVAGLLGAALTVVMYVGPPNLEPPGRTPGGPTPRFLIEGAADREAYYRQHGIDD